MEGLNALEEAVLDMLLAGEHPALAKLRSQARKARLVGRELSGVGFFCNFAVEDDVPSVGGDFQIADVHGELDGLSHGAGFVLFVCAGRLRMLEGFTFDEPWPPQVSGFRLQYDREPRKLQLP
jgi:hypothetical protein